LADIFSWEIFTSAEIKPGGACYLWRSCFPDQPETGFDLQMERSSGVKKTWAEALHQIN
jgi:hypothetical protein